MGYYIDFIFSENRVQGYHDVVGLFCDNGAGIFRFQEELCDAEKAWNEKTVSLTHPDFIYFITVFKKENQDHKGNWAQVRISWGEDADSFATILSCILRLAKTMGCTVYDGQVGAYITQASIDRLRQHFSKTACGILGCIGKTNQRCGTYND